MMDLLYVILLLVALIPSIALLVTQTRIVIQLDKAEQAKQEGDR